MVAAGGNKPTRQSLRMLGLLSFLAHARNARPAS